MSSLLNHIQSERSEQSEFAYLAHMLAGWFGQDYLMDSDDFRVLVASYKRDVPSEEASLTVRDIERFYQRYGENNDTLKAAMDRVFFPCILVEGWDGLTTEAWLLQVAELLRKDDEQVKDRPSRS